MSLRLPPAWFRGRCSRRALLVDLMWSAGGLEYAEAARGVVVREVDGVPIPFASPRLPWRMKAVTHREKDAADVLFLRPLVRPARRGAAAGLNRPQIPTFPTGVIVIRSNRYD